MSGKVPKTDAALPLWIAILILCIKNDMALCFAKSKQECQDFNFNDKLAFNAEWLDRASERSKRLIICFYPANHSIEIFDRDLERIFYKRTKTELLRQDLFIGNIISFFGRNINITDYADESTKRIVGNRYDTTFTIIKPYVVDRIGEILIEIWNRGFKVVKMRTCSFTRREALDLYEPFKGDPYLAFILEELVSGPLIAMEIVGRNALEQWLIELGPAETLEARRVAPNSMRAIFGGDSRVLNGFHAANSKERAILESRYFFPRSAYAPTPQPVLKYSNSTCCIIKPHAIKAGLMGPIFNKIKASNFLIYACRMVYLTTSDAAKFLEVYKGVVNDFNSLMGSFLGGPCMALEIASKKEEVNVHEEFRKLCGPKDPQAARQIRPYTLRAIFGVDRHKNAVHCTDLAEDTHMDLDYCFKIMKA